MRYNCTREGMGGDFKCIFYGSIYHLGGSCTKIGPCDDKKLDPRDKPWSGGTPDARGPR